MAEILVDKSWVQGASSETLAAAAAGHDLLMPEPLFYELLTTERDKQIICFARLSSIQSSIRLLCDNGDLLRYEARASEPASPLIDRCIGRNISFHPTSGTTGYPFTREQLDVIAAEQAEREGVRLQDLKEMSSVVSGWFPDLKGLPAGSPRERIRPFLERVSADADMVREIYGAIRAPEMPDPSMLDERWAFFRLIQVRLVGSLEYIRRYGDGNENAKGKKVPNFFLDQDYLIPALLAEGLATCDNEMRDYYKLLAPSKRVFSSGGERVPNQSPQADT